MWYKLQNNQRNIEKGRADVEVFAHQVNCQEAVLTGIFLLLRWCMKKLVGPWSFLHWSCLSCQWEQGRSGHVGFKRSFSERSLQASAQISWALRSITFERISPISFLEWIGFTRMFSVPQLKTVPLPKGAEFGRLGRIGDNAYVSTFAVRAWPSSSPFWHDLQIKSSYQSPRILRAVKPPVSRVQQVNLGKLPILKVPQWSLIILHQNL